MKFFLYSLISLTLSLSYAQADDRNKTGEKDFNQYCAKCHGIEGKLKKEDLPTASDLTQLSAKNGGHFPYAKVRAVIDGRPNEGNIRPHSSEMPTWGKVFREKESSAGGQLHANAVAKMRILNIIDYLHSIQAEDNREL